MNNSLNPEQLFRTNLSLIQDLIGFICRQNHLHGEHAEDFGSIVKLRLMENDFAVFSKYQSQASLKTYLNSVIFRYYLDFRNKLWGRWRPSTMARDLGSTAALLEQLVYRDKYSLEQAIEILITNHHVSEKPKALRNLFEKIPQHRTRSEVDEDHLAHIEHPAPHQGEQLLETEHNARKAALFSELERAKKSLNEEERFILHMHFQQNLSIASIARSLNCNQRRLYRRLEKILKKLSHYFKKKGVRVQDVKELLA